MNTLKKLKINNVFGIKPSLNCEAAGLDFYIPNIPADVTEEQYETILTARILVMKTEGISMLSLMNLCYKLLHNLVQHMLNKN